MTVCLCCRCVLGNTTILAEFVSEEDVARYIAHSQPGGGGAGGAGSGGTTAGSTGSGPSAASAVGASSNGGSCERGGAGGGGGGDAAGGAGGGTGHSSSGWQSLDSTGSSSDQAVPPGPGLGIFSQWSTNGTAVGGVGGVGAEPGRQGLWGGMGGMGGAGGGGGGGYPSSSLWGSPALDDRHQMGSPASLLPGDLLGGGADSI